MLYNCSLCLDISLFQEYAYPRDLLVRPHSCPTLRSSDLRRFLKTHLPVDALLFSPKARYIYIGRDGRDVAWSMYNHHANANHLWYEALNDMPEIGRAHV